MNQRAIFDIPTKTPQPMSKREKKFNQQMQQSLLNLYIKGEISEYTLKVTQDSVSFCYVNGKPVKSVE